MNPFKYRPEDLQREDAADGSDDIKDDLEWEDNPISNFMAYVSQIWPLEPMCNEEEYLSSRIANYFYTSCPCCLFYRGLFTGMIVMSVLFGGVILALYLTLTY